MSSAYDDAVTLLAGRARTRLETRDRLAAKGHAADAIEEALDRLEAERALDDRAVARQVIATRGAGRGRERLAHELRARGIDDAVFEEAWRQAAVDGLRDEGDALGRAVRRRLGAPPGSASRARLARVYNALLSEGFEPASVASALLPYGFRGHEE